MSDRRSHRGAHPCDHLLFGPESLERLRAATSDLSWLLSRGYTDAAGLALVGDRYRLDRRQRQAVHRTAAADTVVAERRTRLVTPDRYPGHVVVDGFNVLITVEGAMGGAVILAARDGCFRDLAGLRGTYRIVEETRPAAEAIGRTLADAGVSTVTWLLDRPVSNSGRLAALLQAEADGRWRWDCILTEGADERLRKSAGVVATADSGILDRGVSWVNLSRAVIMQEVPEAWIVRLAEPPG